MGKFDKAIQLLNCFVELHHLHMHFEDEQLAPKLHELGDQGRWPASLYINEHAKVQELIDKTQDNLLFLSESKLSDKQLRREIIAALDREKTLKGLCEHHQEREEAGILPELDSQTDTDWRVGIIEPFLKKWNAQIECNMEIVSGIDYL